MSARNTNFYYSFLALGREKRKAVIAVWDFCRAVDDTVDEQESVVSELASSIQTTQRAHPGRRSAVRLQAWREELAACYHSTPQTSEGRRLAFAIRRFALPQRCFEELLNGVEMDLECRRYGTFEELYEYCYRVASVVGLICLEIFGYRNPDSRRYAVNLGIALQLTNIIRDFSADLAKGRLYVPLEDLARVGLEEQDLMRECARDRLVRLARLECERARDFYARARHGLPCEDRRRLVSAEIMRAIYFGILRQIERSGYDLRTRAARLSRPRRATIAAATWARTMVGF